MFPPSLQDGEFLWGATRHWRVWLISGCAFGTSRGQRGSQKRESGVCRGATLEISQRHSLWYHAVQKCVLKGRRKGCLLHRQPFNLAERRRVAFDRYGPARRLVPAGRGRSGFGGGINTQGDFLTGLIEYSEFNLRW
jgi:hypothetical protein